MGKIIGESFKPYVNKQVEVRQKKLGQPQHDNDFQTWVTNKTPWLRLSSGVNLDSESLRNLGIDILDSDKFQNELLAQNYVLFGGTINANNANPIKGGITSNLESRYLDDNNSYGFDSNTDYGFSPMPGITSATIKSENRGSLRTAIINLKCHNTNQFDIIESLYLRLKYTILLEWGHTVYYDNNDTLVTNPTNDVYKYFLFMKETGLKNLSDTSGSYQNQIFNKIEEARKDSGGNYDGFLGWVTNFKWSLLKDGSYDIEINAITIGDVIESLGANIPLPSFNATKNIAKEVLEAEAQAIQDKIDKEEAERLKEDQKEQEIQTLLAQQPNPWIFIVTNLIGTSQVGNPNFIPSIANSGFYPDVNFPKNINLQGLSLPLATDWRGNFVPNTASDPNNFSIAISKEEWQFDVNVRQYRYAIGLSDKTPN
jgi:hypothetical protein